MRTLTVLLFVLSLCATSYGAESLRPELINIAKHTSANVTLVLKGGTEVTFNPSVHNVKVTETKCRVDLHKHAYIVRIDAIVAIKYIPASMNSRTRRQSSAKQKASQLILEAIRSANKH